MKQTDRYMKNGKHLLYGILLLLLVNIVYAQIITPSGFVEGINAPLTTIRNWYSVEGYMMDDNGKQIPIFNEQYKGMRMIIDFFLIFALLGFALKGNKYLKEWGKYGPAFVAFLISFSFVVTANMGFITSFTPFVMNLPFIAAALGIYVGLTGLFSGFGKKELGVGSKLIILIIAAAIVFGLFFFMNKSDISILSQFSKIPGLQSSGGGADLPKGRLLAGGGAIDISQGTPFDRATKMLVNAQTRLNNALKLEKENKIEEAKAEITAAKTTNREGVGILK